MTKTGKVGRHLIETQALVDRHRVRYNELMDKQQCGVSTGEEELELIELRNARYILRAFAVDTTEMLAVRGLDGTPKRGAVVWLGFYKTGMGANSAGILTCEDGHHIPFYEEQGFTVNPNDQARATIGGIGVYRELPGGATYEWLTLDEQPVSSEVGAYLHRVCGISSSTEQL